MLGKNGINTIWSQILNLHKSKLRSLNFEAF